jgi:repressor of nif and glnA expression
MVARLAGVARHRVAVDPHQAFGLADAAPLLEVLEDGRGLLPGQVRAEQRGALAFGEAIAAGAASEEADRGVLAVATGDGEVFAAPDAVLGTSGIQAAELREVVHGPPPAAYRAIRARSCDSELG